LQFKSRQQRYQATLLNANALSSSRMPALPSLGPSGDFQSFVVLTT